MLKSLLSAILLILAISSVFAQTITVREFKQVNQEVILTVVIDSDHSPRERYELSLFSSFDGGTFNRLNKKYSDIEPGIPLTIRLQPSELSGSGTKLSLRVDIDATTFPLVVKGNPKVKRGKSFRASWSGYKDSGPYKIELVDGNSKQTLGNESDSNYTGSISKEIDKGSYKLRVTPSNPDAYGEMDFKVVGGKAALFIIPIVAGGGAAAYFLTSGEDPIVQPEGLPGPPTVPE